MEGLFTKRWFKYFFLFFLTWYPSAFLVSTAYEVFGNAPLFIVASVITPLWLLLFSYLYFRGARDDWTARTVTAFGWMSLMFVCAAILIQPVYGYSWTNVFTLDSINANWMNLVAILVGGTAAHRAPTE